MSSTVVRRPVLADRVITRSLATDALLVVAGAGLTAALAQVAVPLWPVPITGQTLAVLLVGGSLGALRGSLSMVLYLLVGALGAPIYSDAASGWAVLGGPTGGYIVGFILAAALTGWLAERKWDRRFLGGMVSYLAGSAVVFAVGLPWLGFSLGLTVEQTLAAGLFPFIIGGIIKAVIAAGLIRAGWFAVGRRSAES
ncbi:biotin transporter BioY [Amnibacterium flavum]|uniref:Biotin transporter n=1 Tax=Amnibacterium flavum TaxID=2173173 RepID=A0A2V1HRY2_9MICO|nr:biotin transporter BioY [Amnibacterium flavum]PVZ94422.1 biotin transporter BioY [Amnibacterium flavum]